MRRSALQLSRRHKLVLYASSLAVFGSGVVWWLLDKYATTADEFGGLVKHPAQPWMLKLHGAAAMLILIVLGSLLPIHVKKGWQAKKNVPSGGSVLLVFTVLIITGYGLYYVGGEELRALTSQVHLWVGFALPAVIIWHVARGHWLRRHGRLRQIASTTP